MAFLKYKSEGKIIVKKLHISGGFIKLPKFLFDAKACDQTTVKMSLQAKVLYAFLADRLAWSTTNNLVDIDKGKFVICSIKEAMATLGCSKNTAIKAFTQLGRVYTNPKTC